MTNLKQPSDPSSSEPLPATPLQPAPVVHRSESPKVSQSAPVGVTIGDVTVKIEPAKIETDVPRSDLHRWAPSIVAVTIAVVGASASLLAARYTSITEAEKTAALREQVAADLKRNAEQINAAREATDKQLFAQTMEVLAKTADKDFMAAMPPLLSLCVQSKEAEARQMAFAALKVLSYTCDDVCSSKESQVRSSNEKISAQSCWTACDALKATVDEADSIKLSGCKSVAPPKTTGALKKLCAGESDKNTDLKTLEEEYEGLRAQQKVCTCGFAKVFKERKAESLAAEAQKQCDSLSNK